MTQGELPDGETVGPSLWRRRGLGLAVLVVGVVGLLVPLPGRYWPPCVASVQDLVHVPLFAAMSWALWQIMGGRGTAAALVALGLAVGAEVVQPWFDRSESLADAINGACGVALFLAWRLTSGLPKGWSRFALRLASAAACLTAPLAMARPTIADAVAAWREFPVLAEFGSPWANRRWYVQYGYLRSDPSAGEVGVGVLTGQGGAPSQASIVLFPMHRDWSAWKRLEVEFTVEDGPLSIMLSVRDGRRVKAPLRRFDLHGEYPSGRRRVSIDLGELARGSNDVAPIDVAAVQSFHFEIWSRSGAGFVRLHRVWLEQ